MSQQTSDHDLLLRIDERVEMLCLELPNHARRIGRLERWRSWIAGGLAIVGLLYAGMVATAVALARKW